MIESIKLRNWKTHADSSFGFSKGTNVLVGQMGSGKSSVMDAISFALFGTFPSLQSRRVSLEEIIMNKPSQQEEAFVELGFSYEGKSYKIERVIKRKGSSEAKIYCDSKFIAGPKPRDVNDAVEKAIEINYNLFSRAVYSEQNEIDSFLRLSPTNRKAKFDELLDLQRYEKVRANSVTALNRLKGIAEDKGRWVSEQKRLLDGKEEKSILERIGKKEEESKGLEAKAGEKEKAFEKLEKEVKELELEEKKFRQLKEKLAESKAVLAELEKAVQETKSEAKGKGLAAVLREQEELLAELKLLEKEIVERENERKELGKKKEEFGKQAALSEKKIEELNNHLKELEGLGAECPVCKKELEAKTKDQLVKETEEEAKRNALALEKALKEEASANEKAKALEEKEKKAREKREHVKENQLRAKQLVESLEKLAEKEKKLKELEEKVKELEIKVLETKFDEAGLSAKRELAFEEKAGFEAAKKGIEANQQLVKEMRLCFLWKGLKRQKSRWKRLRQSLPQ